MEKSNNWKTKLLRIGSYVLVAALASFVTCFAIYNGSGNKLIVLRTLINQCFIGEVDQQALEDGAAQGMVDALPDRWSYYIPASQMQANEEHMQNAYVGVGITVSMREDGTGGDILLVEPTGGAREAGILPGDILTHVEGQPVADIGIEGVRNLVRGEENTQVELTVQRDGQAYTYQVTRRSIQVQVASGQLLDGNIGYISIVNFNERCAQETIAQIEDLIEQGAKALIFDVRFNPGGYKEELVDLLDYLLPEGDLFHSQFYNGQETVDTSDAACLQMPMAVLINGDSYSAAEFFAAALAEYDWATLVGDPTVGKGYFQNTIELGDGSAVALSVGKYFTPNGVCLEDVGGLQPDVEVPVDAQTAASIYADLLPPEEDPQVQAAVEALG